MAKYRLTVIALSSLDTSPTSDCSSDFLIWQEAALDSQISVKEPSLEHLALRLNSFHPLLHLQYDLWGDLKLDVLGARKEIAKHMPTDNIS